MIELYNYDNMMYETDKKFNLIYADYIYNNKNFDWVDKYWNMLLPNSVFIAQTDDSTIAEMKLKLDYHVDDAVLINICIMVQEWGGVPKKGFPRKHDYVLIYAKGKDFKWYGDRIQIPKATAGTKFDKKGTGLKTPCSVFYDLGNFSTMSNERVKNTEGKNIRWQKKLSFMERITLPFLDKDDWVLDPFMGSGTTGVVCKKNNWNFVGIEYDTNVYNIAKERIENYGK